MIVFRSDITVDSDLLFHEILQSFDENLFHSQITGFAWKKTIENGFKISGKYFLFVYPIIHVAESFVFENQRNQ